MRAHLFAERIAMLKVIRVQTFAEMLVIVIASILLAPRAIMSCRKPEWTVLPPEMN